MPRQNALRMSDPIVIRRVEPADFEAWLPLWDGYNAFYGRKDETALPSEITPIDLATLLRPG